MAGDDLLKLLEIGVGSLGARGETLPQLLHLRP